MCLAVPGRVVSVHETDGQTMAEVDFGGLRKEVCLAYIPDVQVGEYVIVHVGFAIQRLDEAVGAGDAGELRQARDPRGGVRRRVAAAAARQAGVAA